MVALQADSDVRLIRQAADAAKGLAASARDVTLVRGGWCGVTGGFKFRD